MFQTVNCCREAEYSQHQVNRHLTLVESFSRLLFGLALLWFSAMSGAQSIDVSRLAEDKLDALGVYSDVFIEDQTPLTLDAARDFYREGRFARGTRPVLNFGIGARPVWVRLALFNSGSSTKTVYATLGTSWIDHLDAYLVSGGELAVELHAGDALPGAIGVLPGIGTGWLLQLPAGHSELYLRAQTPDPLLLPLALVPERKLAANERDVHYAYGALYGFLLALIVYNCMLFFGVHRPSHLYYALYLLCFIFMNLSYTGHGFAYIWPDRPDVQRNVIVASIVIYGTSGLLFANNFLEVAQHARRLSLWVRGFALAGLLAMALCFALDSQLAAVYLAFSYLSTVTVVMVALGVHAVLKRRDAGTYFLAATLFGMLGAAATTTSVWGAIPYNMFTYHGIDVGIVIEATLLALALARQVRYEQTARLQAEYLAQRDPLTGLYNRRAFIDLSRVAWAQSERKPRPLSVLILDIDHFKQINDRHGHEGGDKLLISASSLLTKTCRTGDLLARWGGEEFVLLLPDTDLDQARLYAERMRQIFEETGHAVHRECIHCTASIGVAERVGDATLDALIARADTRLYEAKAGGRNRVCG